jgi:hypothetical protein
MSTIKITKDTPNPYLEYLIQGYVQSIERNLSVPPLAPPGPAPVCEKKKVRKRYQGPHRHSIGLFDEGMVEVSPGMYCMPVCYKKDCYETDEEDRGL